MYSHCADSDCLKPGSPPACFTGIFAFSMWTENFNSLQNSFFLLKSSLAFVLRAGILYKQTRTGSCDSHTYQRQNTKLYYSSRINHEPRLLLLLNATGSLLVPNSDVFTFTCSCATVSFDLHLIFKGPSAVAASSEALELLRVTFLYSCSALCHPHQVTPLTFPKTVADTGIPGQQGVSTGEAQDQRVCQAEDGEGVGHSIVPGSWLHTTYLLKEQSPDCCCFFKLYMYVKTSTSLNHVTYLQRHTEPLLMTAALPFLLLLKHQQRQTVWDKHTHSSEL